MNDLSIVPLPPGAQPAFPNEWHQDGGRHYRFIETETRDVGNARVYAECTQWEDGSIYLGNDACLNRPRISLDTYRDGVGRAEWTATGIQLTAIQARVLASLLSAAADELDGWLKR